MEPEVKQEVHSSEVGTDEVKVDINTDDSGSLSSFSFDTSNNEQWQEIVDKVSGFLADLPAYLSEFFGKYKRPIVTVGLVFGSIVAVKLTLAILASVNDIPLLAPSLELIGLGYSVWFVYRYLLRASNRKELSEDFNALKEQVLGKRSL